MTVEAKGQTTKTVKGLRATSGHLSKGLTVIPTQDRAKRTLEHILTSAVVLLSEEGLSAFNTNRLAECAGVTVPTIYRYFPNKLLILEELGHRLVASWGDWLDEESLADPANDWRVVWTGYIDEFVSGVIAAPAGLAIRSALHSIPELREIETEDISRFAKRLARALTRRDPTLSRRRASAAAELLITTAIATFDQALTGSPRLRGRRIQELKEMQLAYLATILEGAQ